MKLETYVGPIFNADGHAERPVRQARTGELMFAQGVARYAEMASRRQTFTLLSKSVTIAATHVAPIAATTGTFLCGIYKPTDSGMVGAIVLGTAAVVSGTPGGPFYWDVGFNGITTATSTGTILNNYLSVGSANAGSVMKAVNNVALAGMSTACSTMRPLGGPAAVAAGAGLYTMVDSVDGMIIVPPGCFCGISAHAAGTTVVVSTSITWQEFRVA